MATFRDRRIKDDSQTTNMGEELSVKKGFYVPPLTGATVKDSKKKKKDNNKEKKKSSNGVNQSKNSEKLQTEQWANGEMSDAQSKGHVKAKEQKSKSKNPKDVAPVPTEESYCTHQEQDSLRWERVLEDPVAEAQRLDIYRHNRRKRYLASKQAFLQNLQTGLCVD